MFLPSSPNRGGDGRPQSPQHALRVATLGALGLVLLGVLVFRLWSLQVLASASYAAAANEQQVREVVLPAKRGRILDVKGRPLVTNRLGLEVQIDLTRLPEVADRKPVLRRLSKILGIPAKELERRVAQKAKTHPLGPVTVQRDVPAALVGLLKERAAQFVGVRINEVPLRYYPYRRLGSHLYGSLGEIGEKQLDDPNFRCFLPARCYQPGDVIGYDGVEGRYDKYLRGRDGRLAVQVDAYGNPSGPAIPRPAATSGYDLRLTIDKDVQRAAEAALQEGLNRGARLGADAGAVVAIDPRDGAIRAMASWPDFDPNWMISRDKPRFKRALASMAKDARGPIVDRAIAGRYTPGSVFKPVTAIAASNEKKLLPGQTVQCKGKVFHFKWPFVNWDPNVNEPMTLSTALERSCNTFFIDLAMRLYKLDKSRGNPLQKTARQFGFGHPTGIDIDGEAAGLVPDPAYKHKRFPLGTWDWSWYPGDSGNLSIGQGFLTSTPLQLAVMYAALANGGTVVTPHIAQSIERNGQVVRGIGTTPRRKIEASPAILAEIREGLYNVTHSVGGTADDVFSKYAIDVAGKTGTAETPQGDNAIFASFAPVDDPRIVLVVVIEKGGHGGETAAPAALTFYCKYFEGASCPTIPDLVQDESQ